MRFAHLMLRYLMMKLVQQDDEKEIIITKYNYNKRLFSRII